MPTSRCQIQMRCIGRSVPVWVTFGFTGPRDQVQYQGQYSDVGRDQLITLDLNPYVGTGSLVDYGRICYPIVVLDSGTWDPFHFHRRGVVSPTGFVFGMGGADSQLPARFQFDDPPLPGMGTPFTLLYAAEDQMGNAWRNDGKAPLLGCAPIVAGKTLTWLMAGRSLGGDPWSVSLTLSESNVATLNTQYVMDGGAIPNRLTGTWGRSERDDHESYRASFPFLERICELVLVADGDNLVVSKTSRDFATLIPAPAGYDESSNPRDVTLVQRPA